MVICSRPTETSFVSLDIDFNDFGLGGQLTWKSPLFPFNSLTFYFLFLTFSIEWDIDKNDLYEGGDDDAMDK